LTPICVVMQMLWRGERVTEEMRDADLPLLL